MCKNKFPIVSLSKWSTFPAQIREQNVEVLEGIPKERLAQRTGEHSVNMPFAVGTNSLR